uniref:Uncharacterized protein n=1 Tax=Rangifer tarandus platyrhynchus TaxID=3082113 RepID=A0ACB0FM65_RANTA|nr:unnamed protein product [Rangifer tarandus platyrhynchus]
MPSFGDRCEPDLAWEEEAYDFRRPSSQQGFHAQNVQSAKSYFCRPSRVRSAAVRGRLSRQTQVSGQGIRRLPSGAFSVYVPVRPRGSEGGVHTWRYARMPKHPRSSAFLPAASAQRRGCRLNAVSKEPASQSRPRSPSVTFPSENEPQPPCSRAESRLSAAALAFSPALRPPPAAPEAAARAAAAPGDGPALGPAHAQPRAPPGVGDALGRGRGGGDRKAGGGARLGSVWAHCRKWKR